MYYGVRNMAGSSSQHDGFVLMMELVICRCTLKINYWEAVIVADLYRDEIKVYKDVMHALIDTIALTLREIQI